ncbi:MAG: ferrous iron transport protein B [Cytophagales bacterium]|nr:ferrous iron transport protein B [Cytophagales bacterium]
MNPHPKIALVGNPNAGKSSLFNQLTGLNQKVGNFPGVTVDRKTGVCRLNDRQTAHIIDLPGTYSLYPKSPDEQVVANTLLNRRDEWFPDLVVVVADATNLKRNLLLFSEVKDLGLPVLLVLNMMDVAGKSGVQIDLPTLRQKLGVPIATTNARTGEGLADLKREMSTAVNAETPLSPADVFVDNLDFAPQITRDIREKFGLPNDYLAVQYAHQADQARFLDDDARRFIEDLRRKHDFQSRKWQAEETLARYEKIRRIVSETVQKPAAQPQDTLTARLDKVFLHRVWGFVVFFGILFLIFQAIFAWAQYPMDFIDGTIAQFTGWLHQVLPPGMITNLITDGLIAGIGGVLIFIPQIAILFAFISLLEETGYMARVVFITDRVMRTFGLNGKSVVPLMSGVACAVPAIMATRNIDNWRERLITIMVTPLMSCSARIPIYTILVALVVPERQLLGVFNLQGVVLMGLYLLGFVAAILSAWLMQAVLQRRGRSFLVMEMPDYKAPRWGNVGLTILEKVRTFVVEAGKVIVAIAVVLWVLASYGPGDKMERAEAAVQQKAANLPESERENQLAAARLEASYAGHFGKFIEPVIRPLGYDWKIGIALITSFAAREVFVGTLSTIYSVGSNSGEDMTTIQERLRTETNPQTGGPMYTPAVSFSLLKWPVIQFVYMTGLAYVSALVVYQVFK